MVSPHWLPEQILDTSQTPRRLAYGLVEPAALTGTRPRVTRRAVTTAKLMAPRRAAIRRRSQALARVPRNGVVVSEALEGGAVALTHLYGQVDGVGDEPRPGQSGIGRKGVGRSREVEPEDDLATEHVPAR